MTVHAGYLILPCMDPVAEFNGLDRRGIGKVAPVHPITDHKRNQTDNEYPYRFFGRVKRRKNGNRHCSTPYHDSVFWPGMSCYTDIQGAVGTVNCTNRRKTAFLSSLPEEQGPHLESVVRFRGIGIGIGICFCDAKRI